MMHKRIICKGVLKFPLKLQQLQHVSVRSPSSGSSHSTLPVDGDHTKTCWSYCNFNGNFNTPLL